MAAARFVMSACKPDRTCFYLIFNRKLKVIIIDQHRFDSHKCAMKPIKTPGQCWDVYDLSRTPLGEIKWFIVALCLFSFLLSSFWWRSYQPELQLISFFLCPLILLSLPRLVRNVVYAYKVAPIFRFNEQGLWARDWSYLGWITWRNILSVEITSDRAFTKCSVAVQLADAELNRLSFVDRVCRMLVNELVRVVQSDDDNQKTLMIAGDATFDCSEADFKLAINQVLANASVPCKWTQTFA
jgi:hypothetical protein